ncbi:hypothetical protein [Rhabdothermincola salaria]|uniref:hypothetical protein n=1 Tax=Rhabdothermincola salaria TaxID=2903142 RepID=UPI001E2D9B71|nr:hypothetical protein [Rhabdothermincola salaria]MCD9623282.1 hypothetical protein [Rhabdothermincola salaria]
MTGRTRHAALVALLALILTISAVPVSHPAGAQAPTGATPADCSERVEVLLLIDESASLDTTDPGNERVAAGEILVRSLAASASASGGTVGLTIAGFASAVEEAGQATLPQETDAAVGVVASFADRREGRNTDYVLALRYAAEYFTTLTEVPTDCKRLVWFTDGAYSIDDVEAPGIATYTASTDADAIEDEFEGQTCGALPAPSRLTAPLSEQIRAAGFVVQLVDFLGSGTPTSAEAADRAATAPVIDRLLTGDDTEPCRVPGGRVEASQASALAVEFFNQGQIALGRREVSCDLLATGLPAPLTRAVTVRADPPGATVTLVRDGSTVASGAGYATFVAPDDVGAVGRVTVQVSGGAPAGCFADLAALISPAGEATIFGAAESSTVRVDVFGAAAPASGTAGERLGPDAVDVTARTGDQDLAVTWQEAGRTWEITVPGPVDAPPTIVIEATTPEWGPVGSLTQEVSILGSPPVPAVVWDGPDTIEGDGTFRGRLTVLPGASTDGTLCVTFGDAQVDRDGVTVRPSDPEVCGADTQPFDIGAEIVVDGVRNDTATVTLPYTVTYAPPGATQGQPLGEGGEVAFPTLTLTRPADAATSALITVGLVVVSSLLPLGLLLLLVNLQRRLPSPDGRRLATLALRSDGGALELAPGAALADSDLRPVSGTRSRYDLAPGLVITGRPTPNPFAAVTVEVTSEIGPVTAVPWMAAGPGRSVEVPAAFEFLVLLRSDPGSDHGEALVVVPPGAGAAEAEEAAQRALASSNRLWSRIASVTSRGI